MTATPTDGMERLRAENERLRAAMEEAASLIARADPGEGGWAYDELRRPCAVLRLALDAATLTEAGA